MALTYRQVLAEKMKDPEFRKEWEELEPEFQIIEAMLKARDERNISQRQLSERTGITQADISKIENGEANPTLQTLKRIANGLDMRLELTFVPINNITYA